MPDMLLLLFKVPTTSSKGSGNAAKIRVFLEKNTMCCAGKLEKASKIYFETEAL